MVTTGKHETLKNYNTQIEKEGNAKVSKKIFKAIEGKPRLNCFIRANNEKE